MGRSWLDALDGWGEKVLRGRFAQQFAALFFKNGELQLHRIGAAEATCRASCSVSTYLQIALVEILSKWDLVHGTAGQAVPVLVVLASAKSSLSPGIVHRAACHLLLCPFME